MAPKVIIIGGGITGLSLALALHKIAHFPPSSISLHELRPEPSTIGGAVNLTPNAVRYLEKLGVRETLAQKACEVPRIELFAHRNGQRLGELCFNEVSKYDHRALRAKRGNILAALTETWVRLGGAVKYGSRICGIEEQGGKVLAEFEDGSIEESELLVGADGTHSWVRTGYVQPERTPVYSGVATAYGNLKLKTGEEVNLPVLATSLFSSRRGSLIVSYCDKEKTELYAAAVMESAVIGGRDGWKVKGSDQVAVKQEMTERLGGPNGIGAAIEQLIERVENWYLHPVFKLPPHGKWSRGNVLLLGDAAHAMPPMGESMGIAIEDAMLFVRIWSEHPEQPISESIDRYVRNRTAKIDTAFDEASWRWESVKDAGFITTLFKEYVTGLFLWWTKDQMDKNWASDIMTAELVE